jgi:hypothetical protein
VEAPLFVKGCKVLFLSIWKHLPKWKIILSHREGGSTCEKLCKTPWSALRHGKLALVGLLEFWGLLPLAIALRLWNSNSRRPLKASLPLYLICQYMCRAKPHGHSKTRDLRWVSHTVHFGNVPMVHLGA